MATNRKVLGQSAPAAATPTSLYIVPADTSAVASTLTACNQGAVDTTIRVAVRPAGAALADEHYVVFDAPLPANDTLTLTIGWTLAATDVVTVQTLLATVSFSLFGEETS